MRLTRFVFISLFCLQVCNLAWAQRDLATLTGTITDQSAAVVPSATVTITEVATGLAYKVTTDTSGTYVRPALKPGTYTVEVEAQGFKRAIQRDVLLTAGDRVAVNLSLQLGDTSQTVDVASEAPLLQTENTTIGGDLNSRATSELPLGGQRKVAFLARLAVGVLADENGQPGNVGGGFSAAGVSSFGNNNYLLNGVDNNINNIDYQGLAAYVVSLPPDAIGEMRILTNGYNAEYGRAGGGVMEVTMKSGTNQFHGVAYEFLQNDKLNANPWEANKGGISRGAWKQNQFGAVLGGPVIRNRTFFFASYEGLRFSSFGSAVPGIFTGAGTIYTIPTPAMVQGDFSAELGAVVGTDSLGNPVRANGIYDPNSTTANGSGGFTRTPFPNDTIPLSRMDPVAAKILSGLPAPNQNLGAAIPGSNYFAPASARQGNDQGSIRVDHRISDKDMLFGSLTWSNGTQNNPPALSAVNHGALTPGYDATMLSRLAMLSYTRTWSPTILSETRAGYNRSVQLRSDSDGTQDGYQLYGIPGYDPFHTEAGGGLPTFSISGYSTLGGPAFNPSYEWSMVYDFIQNVAVNHGKHAFKFGAEYKPVRLPTYQPNFPHGQMAFTKNFTNNPNAAFAGRTGDALASFELGYDSSFAFSTSNITNQAHDTYGFYAQDDWKVTPKLTLNIGLRYELFSPFYDNHSGQGNIALLNGVWTYEVAAGPHQNLPFSGGETAFLQGAGIPVTIGKVSKYLIPWDKSDFGPRIGFAYQFTPKMVVRGAFGMFYNGEQDRGGYAPADINPPFNEDINYTGPTYTPNLYVPRISNGFPSNLFDVNIPQSRNLHGVAQDLLNPRVSKWNVAIQRELPFNTALEVSYLGNYMSHLYMAWDPNMPPNSPNVSVATNTLNSIRPYPALGGMPNFVSSFGYGNYDALGVKLEKRYSQGLQFTTAYTWGHSLAAAGTSVQGLGNVASPDARNMGDIYASTPWDIRQNFVASAIYDLPFGKGRTYGSDWNPVLSAILGNWQANGLLTLHTGHYYQVNTNLGTGYLGYFHGNSYIYASVLAGDSSDSAPSGGRTPNQWFNTSNFAVPTPYVQGNLGNATNKYPATESVDFSLFKEFPFNERLKLTVRAEVFNLFNTPNYASIGSTQGVGNFGQLLTTLAGSQRRMQLGVRFAF